MYNPVDVKIYEEAVEDALNGFFKWYHCTAQRQLVKEGIEKRYPTLNHEKILHEAEEKFHQEKFE